VSLNKRIDQSETQDNWTNDEILQMVDDKRFRNIGLTQSQPTEKLVERHNKRGFHSKNNN